MFSGNRACLIVSHLFIWGDPSVQWLVEPAPVGVTCLVEATPVFRGQESVFHCESLVYVRQPQCSVDNRACSFVSHLFI